MRERQNRPIRSIPWSFPHAAGQIRDEGLVKNKVAYVALALNPNGEKDVLWALDRTAVFLSFFAGRTRRRRPPSVRFRLKLRRSAWASRKSAVSKPSVN